MHTFLLVHVEGVPKPSTLSCFRCTLISHGSPNIIIMLLLVHECGGSENCAYFSLPPRKGLYYDRSTSASSTTFCEPNRTTSGVTAPTRALCTARRQAPTPLSLALAHARLCLSTRCTTTARGAHPLPWWRMRCALISRDHVDFDRHL